MEPEDIVVDTYLIELDEILHRAEHVKHGAPFKELVTFSEKPDWIVI